jgi:beta-glucosidase-like glycosyl hydrolase
VFSTGKHFPGHGDTGQTHKGLPTVSFSKQRLEVMEFYPYKRCLRKDLPLLWLFKRTEFGVKPNYPSSISYNVVTNVLQKGIGLSGLTCFKYESGK